MSKKPCIPVYSLPPTIDEAYLTSMMTQVASAAVDRIQLDGDRRRARLGTASWTRNS